MKQQRIIPGPLTAILLMASVISASSASASAPSVASTDTADVAAQWSYAQCVDYALANNISLRKTRLGEQSASLTLTESKAQWEPSLDFSITQGFSVTPLADGNKTGYNSNYGLNASWTVWDGGKRENTIRRDELQTAISRLTTEDAIRTLHTELLAAYLNALYAADAIEVCRETLQVSDAQADRCRQLLEAGRVSRVDYAQLQSQAEQDRYNLVNAEGTYANRVTELKKILELDLTATMAPSPITAPEAVVLAPLPPIEESYSLALQTDAALKATVRQREAADLDVSIARASGLPSIGLSAAAGASYYAPGGDFGNQLRQSLAAQIGVTLTLPVFDRKKTSTAVARAKVSRTEAELDEAQRRNDIARSVEGWYTDLRAYQARYIAAVEQEKSAATSSSLVDEQFALGLVNTVELLASHQQLLEARHSLLQAKYMAILGQKMIEWYRTAAITLE